MTKIKKVNKKLAKEEILKRASGGEKNISKIAKELGISRNTIYYWIKTDPSFSSDLKVAKTN